MDDLKARLAVLFRHFAEALQQRQGDGPRLAEQFRKELDLLIAQYGPEAVDAALVPAPALGAVGATPGPMAPAGRLRSRGD